jgi:hypothetical protein
MKQKVQDKYRYCSTRRKVLLDHVAEGYECDYWLVLIHFYFLDKKFFSIFISGNIMIMYKDIF